MMSSRRLPLLAAVLLIAACSSDPVKKAVKGDGPPDRAITAADVPDAVPRPEARSRYGNHSPYEVFGVQYRVMNDGAGYTERGLASWYGRKFHGRRTSSGEPYDMYKATAAHRTLPLPSYAEVTNLDNGRRVVVRINDRGPFRQGRLIDLSYGAALRLDMVHTGTARVEVRVLESPGDAAESAVASAADAEPTWVQVGAYSQRGSAENVARELDQARLRPVQVQSGGDLHRVWLGPYSDPVEVESVIRKAIELGYERPHRVRR